MTPNPAETMTLFSGIWTPDLTWENSALLREALDDRFLGFWIYEHDGDFPENRETKDDVEALVAEIQRRNSDPELISVVRQDAMFMRGHPYRGGKPVEELTPRLAALRVLEETLYTQVRALDEESLDDPVPTSRVYSQVPGLFAELTPKDHLFPLSPEAIDTEVRSDDRVFLHGEWALFPSPYVREHRELVGSLARLGYEGNDVQIALDANRLLGKADRPSIGLKDYWYGIKVTMKDIDDPHVRGHLQYARRFDQHTSLDPLAVDPLLLLDVDISVANNLKTFSIEETVPPNGRGTERFILNRFMHSIRDMDRRTWIHIDGAVKAYPRETYEASFEHPTASKGEVTHYRKLWRVDGDFGHEVWGGLLAYHFRGNELVAECFGDWTG